MSHSKAEKDPEDQPTSPLTLDSFDPLRDAETLLEDGTVPNRESDVRGVGPRNAPGSTDPTLNKGGPEGTDEDGERFDAR